MERIGRIKVMKRKRQIIVWFGMLFLMMGTIYYVIFCHYGWKESHSGIPDVVSSIVRNRSYYLTVVANSSKIDDKEAFACEVIQMCRQNSFQSVKLSTDINGYPSDLNIAVYLNYKDIKRNRQACEISFHAKENTEEYDIKNDVEKFHLYLDGKEITFYEMNEENNDNRNCNEKTTKLVEEETRHGI